MVIVIINETRGERVKKKQNRIKLKLDEKNLVVVLG